MKLNYVYQFQLDSLLKESGIIPSLIASGGNLLDMGAQAISNKAQQKFTEKMYGRQRADALADWNMQNEYNSPSATMARLKAGGLNPNLVYGNGATTTAGGVRPSSIGSWNPQPLKTGIAEAVSVGQDAKLKNAQINSLNASADNTRGRTAQQGIDAALKAMQKGILDQHYVQEQIKSFVAQSTQGFQVQVQEANARKAGYAADATLHDDIRKTAMTAQNINESLADVLLKQAQMENLKVTREEILARIKSMGLQDDILKIRKLLNDQGVDWNDNILMRQTIIRSKQLLDYFKTK